MLRCCALRRARCASDLGRRTRQLPPLSFARCEHRGRNLRLVHFAASLVSQEYLGRTWAESARIDAAIAAVTVESANAALRKYVDPAGIGYAYAGDFTKK